MLKLPDLPPRFPLARRALLLLPHALLLSASKILLLLDDKVDQVYACRPEESSSGGGGFIRATFCPLSGELHDRAQGKDTFIIVYITPPNVITATHSHSPLVLFYVTAARLNRPLVKRRLTLPPQTAFGFQPVAEHLVYDDISSQASGDSSECNKSTVRSTYIVFLVYNRCGLPPPLIGSRQHSYLYVRYTMSSPEMSKSLNPPGLNSWPHLPASLDNMPTCKTSLCLLLMVTPLPRPAPQAPSLHSHSATSASALQRGYP